MAIDIPDRIALLQQVQLFRGLDDARLAAVAGQLAERYCDPGETVASKGQTADSLFLIYRGSVTVSTLPGQAADQPAVMGPGGYFGGEAMLPGSVYGADSTARERTALLVLYQKDFNLLPIVPIPDRIAFLSRIHLFNGVGEAQVESVAGWLDERSFAAGEVLFKEGEPGDCVFLIYSGKVRVTRKDSEKPLATLVAGDHVGEESVLAKGHHRTATVTAVENTLTLVLTREHFHQLLKQAPALRANFAVIAQSHRLARRIRFKWLQPDEVVYFLARKHAILLVQSLLWPFLLVLVSVIGMLVAWRIPVHNELVGNSMEIFWYVSLGVGVVAAGWGLWNGVDWGNDYYIVTDRRVIRLEKVIGIYDSRDESPLSAVQRVNVQTQLGGRLLDYGDLIVHTIVGSTLTFPNVDHPYQAAALIEEHWRRSRESSRKMQEEEMRQVLRERLMPGQGQVRPRPIQGIVAKPQEKKNYYKGQRSIVNLFRMRFEQQSTVTYRKHVFVLLAQTWKAVAAILILLGILVYEVTTDTKFSFAIFTESLGADVLLFIWLGLFSASVIWGIYEYIDWSNDIYQVTPDQVMDIDKTPLGQVTSDIAALDNILSIEYKRIGILELLFNYGTVYITVGGSKQMCFENVFNPSAVQEDVERRRLERLTKKEQDSIKAERERMADWFAAYYHGERQFRSDEAGGGEPGKGTPPADGSPPANEAK
jgi:CRP-like cAMP-binding protein